MFVKVVSDLHFDRPWAAKGASRAGLWMPDYQELNPSVVMCVVGDVAKKTWLSTPEGAEWLEELRGKKFKAVLFGMGNNEFWDGGPFLRCDYSNSVSEFRARSQPKSNIHMLENEVFEIEGAAFFVGCMWSDFRGDKGLMDKRLASEKCNEEFLSMTTAGLEASRFPTPHRLAAEGRKAAALVFDRPWGVGKRKFVLGHHPPIADEQDMSMPDAADGVRIHANAFGERIAASDVDFWFYGHDHRRFRKTIGRTTVMSEPANPSWSSPDYADGPDNLVVCVDSMQLMSVASAKTLLDLEKSTRDAARSS